MSLPQENIPPNLINSLLDWLQSESLFYFEEFEIII